MQHTVEIPAPLGADTETVVTALETAALFGSKGDRREAMRWLRRAAESAGEAGDDERALLLSRTVADLHEELEQAPVSMPYPPPPSSRSSRPPSANGRASLPPRPSSRPAPASMRPAAVAASASMRPAAVSASTSQRPATGSGSTSQRPAAGSASASLRPAAGSASTSLRPGAA
jgi:hypothetical protein